MRTEKSDYSRMKTKVSIQLLIMFVFSGAAVLVLYNFLQGRIGVWTIHLIGIIPGISYDRALSVYEAVFRNHWYEFMITAIFLMFLLLFHFSLSWFEKYFNQINKGIKALMSVEHQHIALAPEMKSVEDNLKTVQATLERQREEAAMAERKKDEMLLYLAHDIKTPLTSVVGYLSMLDERKNMDTSQREKCIRVGLDKAEYLEKLIDEFFEITRFRQKDIALSKQDIELHYMLIQLVDEFTPLLQAGEKKAEILMPEDIHIYGNADYLARAFQNVLKNALLYSENRTVIKISAVRQQGCVVIRVTNEGDTLPPEVQEHIFEKFYRADEARQTNTGGAGLGLAIAQNIINLHDGTIHVESRDRKTTFIITLPDIKKA